MTNYLNQAKFIRVGFGNGFYIAATMSDDNTLKINCGDAATCASILKSNRIKHFDYLPSIADSEACLYDFIDGAALVGFEH